jgi:thiamine biosynthesis lipoprotein ApbE
MTGFKVRVFRVDHFEELDIDELNDAELQTVPQRLSGEGGCSLKSGAPRGSAKLYPVYPASITLWFAMAAAASVPQAESELVRLERSLDAMGTTYTIAAYGTDRFALDSAVESAFEEAARLDELLSNYRPESEWSRVNRDAARGPVQVSQELFDLLERCRGYSEASEGAFDITVGPLMKIWGFYKQDGRIPHRAEIRQALGRIGWQNIQLDRAARTVKFSRPIEMDPGGIGKGRFRRGGGSG